MSASAIKGTVDLIERTQNTMDHYDFFDFQLDASFQARMSQVTTYLLSQGLEGFLGGVKMICRSDENLHRFCREMKRVSKAFMDKIPQEAKERVHSLMEKKEKNIEWLISDFQSKGFSAEESRYFFANMETIVLGSLPFLPMCIKPLNKLKLFKMTNKPKPAVLTQANAISNANPLAKFLKEDSGGGRLFTSKRPSVSGKKMVKLFEKHGWTLYSKHGDHYILKKRGAETLSIPQHKTLSRGLAARYWKILEKEEQAKNKIPIVFPLLGWDPQPPCSKILDFTSQKLPTRESHDLPIPKMDDHLEEYFGAELEESSEVKTSEVVSETPFSLSTQISPSLTHPKQSTIALFNPVGNCTTLGVVLPPLHPNDTTLVASHSPLSSTTMGVGITLARPQEVNLSLVHTLNTKAFGATINPANIKSSQITISQNLTNICGLDLCINPSKPLQSTIALGAPVGPLMVGIEFPLKRPELVRIKASLPLGILNPILKPLGISLPNINIFSVSVKKVCNFVGKIFKFFFGLFGGGGSDDDCPPVPPRNVLVDKETLEKFDAEFKKLQQTAREKETVVHTLPSFKEAIQEARSFLSILTKTVRTCENMSQELQHTVHAVNLAFQAVASLEVIIQETQDKPFIALHIIQEFENTIQELEESVKFEEFNQYQPSLKDMEQEETHSINSLTVSITQLQTIIDATDLQRPGDKLREETECLKETVDKTALLNAALQHKKEAIVQKLKVKMSPERAAALNLQLNQ